MLFLPPFCRQQEIEESEELGANARISAVRLLDPTLPMVCWSKGASP